MQNMNVRQLIILYLLCFAAMAVLVCFSRAGTEYKGTAPASALSAPRTLQFSPHEERPESWQAQYPLWLCLTSESCPSKRGENLTYSFVSVCVPWRSLKMSHHMCVHCTVARGLFNVHP